MDASIRAGMQPSSEPVAAPGGVSGDFASNGLPSIWAGAGMPGDLSFLS
jgi:hypothetical protein